MRRAWDLDRPLRGPRRRSGRRAPPARRRCEGGRRGRRRRWPGHGAGGRGDHGMAVARQRVDDVVPARRFGERAVDEDVRGARKATARDCRWPLPSPSRHGRMRMIVFPLRRSVGLRAATASSRVATLPMFVRSRPSRTRWTISRSWARSDSTTKSTARPSAAAPRAAYDGHEGSSGPDQACGRLLDVPADDVEYQVDATDVFQRVLLEVDELLRAEVERLLAVGGASGADDVGANLRASCVTIDPTAPAAPCARTLCPA